MSEALLAEMREAKTEIMTLMWHAAQAGRFSPIVPVSRANGRLPLSYAQQRLWFLSQISRGSAAYNITSALALKGEIKVEVLGKSIEEIVRRHEILRINVVTIDGQPRQIIKQDVNVALEIIDLPEARTDRRKLEDRLRNSANEPFQLDGEPLLRVAIFRIGESDSVLMITVHHIVADLWSLEIFADELSQLYSAFLRGESSPLPDLPVQYVDFAAWQREVVDDPEIEQQLAYWRRVLHKVPELLNLPTDYLRPKEQTFFGATASLQLSRATRGALKSLTHAEGCTLFMTMLAAFQVLLSRYSGQSDVSIGTPIATRSQAATQALIGFFVNTLILRGDLSKNPCFRELMQQARERCLNAYDNQDVPFEVVVDAVQPARALNHQPLFQVMLVVQNPPQARLEMPGLQLSFLEIENQTAKFDLTLFVVDDGECLHLKLEYNTSLFRASTAHRLLGSFSTLVDGIVHDPDARISDLPLLSQAQRANIYARSCAESQEAIQHECLHDAFAAQAQ